MSSILEIQFPEDFDKRYEEYKAQLLNKINKKQDTTSFEETRQANIKFMKQKLTEIEKEEELEKRVTEKVLLTIQSNEKFNREVWWVLQQLKYLQVSSRKGEPPIFVIQVRPIYGGKNPKPEAQEAALLKIEELKAIKIIDRQEQNVTYGKDFIYTLKILQPKFDELYHFFEDSFKKDEEKEIKPASSLTNTFNWAGLSKENLKIAQKVIKITLNFLQFQPINRLSLATRIPLQKFESEKVYFDDASVVLNRVESIKVTNTKLLHEIKEYGRTRGGLLSARVRLPSDGEVLGGMELPSYLPTEDELKRYVFLEISSLDDLHRVKNLIDEQLKIDIKEKDVALPKQKNNIIAIPIKDARLDEQNYLLEINNGEKIVSFKSKKKGEGLEKETKQFKILYHLWDFRWELKDGRVLKKGDFTSLENLVRGSGSESTEAAYKHIQRLNNRFKNESVAIEIKGENEKYRLIINRA